MKNGAEPHGAAVGGDHEQLKFLDAAHVKDLLALLRFVENPRDRVTGFRLMQLIQRVGPASAERVLDYIIEAAEPIGALADAPAPPRSGDDWQAFVETVTELCAGVAGWPAEFERARLWYQPQLDRIHEDAVTRRNDLIQLEQIASGYPSRERFLTELTLDPPDATSDHAGAFARRGLSDPLDDSFRQGAGMEVGLRAQRRRRMHSV